MTNAQQTKKGKQALALLATSKAAEAAEQAKREAKERAKQIDAQGQDIAQAALEADLAEHTCSELVLYSLVAGYSLAELEQVIIIQNGKTIAVPANGGKTRDMRVKDLVRFRKAKQRIVAYLKQGGKIFEGVTWADIAAANKPAPRKSSNKGGGGGSGSGEPPLNPDGTPEHLRYHTQADMIRAALAALQQDADARDENGDLIIALAAKVREERLAEKDAARQEALRKNAA